MKSDKGSNIADGVKWTQSVFIGQIKNILTGRYLDLTQVDQLIRAVADFRSAMGLAAPLGTDSVYYAGLRALHCVDFKRMSVKTQCDIPAALLHTLGIDDQEGSMVLGA